MIEAALQTGELSAPRGDRVVIVYRYGPNGGGARRAAEASVFCMPSPSLGARASCSAQRALYGALAEAAMSELQGSVVQVVYDARGCAEWVVFASTPGELESANEMITRAERGEMEAALQAGRSFAEGARGFPTDSRSAYRWISIAVSLGAEEGFEERMRIRARLDGDVANLIDMETASWEPKLEVQGARKNKAPIRNQAR